MKLYNTMSRKKEELKPIKEGEIGLYTCGPTVYSRAHIGNLRAYIFEDILVRVLKLDGYKVKRVMNITDVGHLTSDGDTGEDKMEKGAKREQLTVWQIAEKYTELFLKDIKALNILEPDVWCKATSHIQEQIDMVQKLIDKGFTYETEDGIYFDTSKLDDYGKLARLDLEGLEAGKRVDLGGKKNPTDFALWKFSPKDEKRQMEWPAFGRMGFPGWHIECSAMAMRYLGETFDIHTGGVDHIPVHHTNEIAQAEASTGKEFVKYWMHNEFLVVPEGKMSKSKGHDNSLDGLAVEPLAYRYFCLNTHYRKQLMYSEEAIVAAQSALTRLRRKLFEFKAEERDGEAADKYNIEFLDAVNDDLNIPKALGILWEMVANEDLSSRSIYDTALKFDSVLGLSLDDYKTEKVDFEDMVVEYEPSVLPEIVDLVKKRHEAKKEKNWPEADKLREEIKKKGFAVEDRKDGYLITKE